MKNYRVLAQCVVHIPMSTSAGPTLGTLYQDATFVGDPNSDKIKHLLESEMICEIDDKGQPVDTADKDSGESTDSGDEAAKPTRTRTSTKAKPDAE